jgi:FkbM family methyltransferase
MARNGIYFTEDSCQIPTLPDIYDSVFGQKTDGMFVEIGAYDGRTWSNTWGLAEIGWKGVYVEPVRELYDKCVNNHLHHKNIRFVQSCIGMGDEVTMYGGLINTASGVYVAHQWAYHDLGKFLTITLDDLWDAAVRWPVDVLVIDVEGMEPEVLRGFSIDEHRPVMVIIEASEKHPDEWMRFNAEYINQYFREHGYTKIYSDAINNIYVIDRKESDRDGKETETDT